MNTLKCYSHIALIAILASSFTSCSKDVEVETETGISYTITMSSDLLKFVTPQVSYVDENGVLVTITGIEDLDGKVIENSAEISSNGSYASSWSSTVITGTGYKCWTIKMKFKHLEFHSHMAVKYLRNDFTEDINGKVYDFHHDINTSVNATKKTITSKGWFGGESVDVSAYSDTHISISSIGDYHYGDDIEAYMLNLEDNPDKAGYYVDENGDITRRDEF